MNCDGIINVSDLSQVAYAYGSFLGEPGYIPAADINLDKIVDMRDLSAVSRLIFQTFP